MIKDKIIVFVPHKIVSEANNRDHWTKKYKRKTALFWSIKAALSQYTEDFPLPCIITLERIGKRNMDWDNLVFSFKSTKDFLAKLIIESHEIKNLAPNSIQVKPMGYHDADSRIEWKYAQRTQTNTFVKNQPLGFWIIIEQGEETCNTGK